MEEFRNSNALNRSIDRSTCLSSFFSQPPTPHISLSPPLPPRYINSTRNDLSWWGLDYPPLSGYQSWLHGKLLTKLLLPEEEKELALALTHESRGFESPGSKRAMRAAVLASDAAVWLPCALAALVVFSSEEQKRKKKKKRERIPLLWPAAAVLLQPALVLVDHGHFQFNGIGLGLSAAAAAAAATDRRVLSSVLFTCSLNHKQMALYYAPAFFGHLLGRCIESAKEKDKSSNKEKTKNKKTPSSSSSSSLSSVLLFLLRAGLRALALGLTVALTMLGLWWPVIRKNEQGVPTAAGALAVLSRLAPVHRGIFEDYVANFWCASHPVFRWKRRFSQRQLARAAAALTLAAAAPSALHQALRPSRRGMLYAMACSSLAFFLFSYQVHEKSILLPLLPVSLLALPGSDDDDDGGEGEPERKEKKRKKKENEKEGFFFSFFPLVASAAGGGGPRAASEPFLAAWLPVAACFSMWPLLHRDGLAWAYAGCLTLWVGAVAASRPEGGEEEEEEEWGGGEDNEEEEKGRLRQRRRRRQQRPRTKADLALLYGPAAFVAGALALHACHALVSPPAALPWLWDAAITTYCAPVFLAAFAYLNLRMWFGLSKSPEEEEEGEEGGEGAGAGQRQQKATSTSTKVRGALPRRAGPAAAAVAAASSSSRAKRD